MATALVVLGALFAAVLGRALLGDEASRNGMRLMETVAQSHL